MEQLRTNLQLTSEFISGSCNTCANPVCWVTHEDGTSQTPLSLLLYAMDNLVAIVDMDAKVISIKFVLVLIILKKS